MLSQHYRRPRRRVIRLKNYDYAQAGMYFITICAASNRHVFGEINDQKMLLNDFGKIAQDAWERLPSRWPHLELGAFQVMPNHFHGILVIHQPVGMLLLKRPAHDGIGVITNGEGANGESTNRATTNGATANGEGTNRAITNGATANGEGTNRAITNWATANGTTANGEGINGVTANWATARVAPAGNGEIMPPKRPFYRVRATLAGDPCGRP